MLEAIKGLQNSPRGGFMESLLLSTAPPRGSLGWTAGRNPSQKEGLGLGRDCPGRFGVPVPGGVQGKPGCGAQGRGGGGSWAGLAGPSQPRIFHGSIVCFYSSQEGKTNSCSAL